MREVASRVDQTGPVVILTRSSDILGSETTLPAGVLRPEAARLNYDKLLRSPGQFLAGAPDVRLGLWAPSDLVLLGRLLQAVVKALADGRCANVSLVIAVDALPTCLDQKMPQSREDCIFLGQPMQIVALGTASHRTWLSPWKLFAFRLQEPAPPHARSRSANRCSRLRAPR